LTPLSESSGTVQLEIDALVEMAVLQRHTAIKTPHPAPVAPLADQRWPGEVNGGHLKNINLYLF